jgi:hypothetical protein
MTCASDEFIAAVLALPQASRHSENTGSVTDIGELASRDLGVSMINISSGYHNPHSHTEVVHLDELQIACDLAYAIATTMGNHRWSHKPFDNWPTYKSYTTTSKWKWSKNNTWDDIDNAPVADFHPHSEYRDKLIADLEDFGYCRYYDQLDKATTDDLEELLFSYEMSEELDSYSVTANHKPVLV